MSFLSTFIAAGSWAEWLNYPGLEAWKFANLIIFLTAVIWILGRPVAAAFESRRKMIREELLNARTAHDEAQGRLNEVEQLLTRVDSDVEQVKQQARKEAEQERQRVAKAAEDEIHKLEIQGQREMDLAHRVALKELREFLAKRSVEVATDSVRAQMRPEDDVRIISSGLEQLRRSGV